MKMPLTHAIVRAIATDAANRSMRKGGRTAWNRSDANAYERALFGALGDRGDMSEEEIAQIWMEMPRQ